MKSRGYPDNFEDYETTVLAKVLREFYSCVRQKTNGTEPGLEYGRSSYRNMRAGIQRHLVSPPYNRKVDIRNDKEFQECNQVFEGKLKQMKREGKDITQHKQSITPGDMKKMYDSKVLGNQDPVSLQRKVFVELGIHFGRRGREGWRELKKDSFMIKSDDNGRRYVTIQINEFDKNHPNDEVKTQIMFENKSDENCPVKSFELYVSKLHPKQPAFFQRPNARYRNKPYWYVNAPIGVNTIGNMLKSISIDAQTSQLYTNHCLKATTVTVLKQAGMSSKDIMSVSGHKNSASLDSYAAAPTMNERAKMSNILSNYSKEDHIKTFEEIATTSNNDIAPIVNIPSTSSAVLSSNMTLENISAGIFHGANFTGPVTINIQINK